MSRNGIGILILLLIPIGLYVYFYEIGVEKKTEANLEVKKVFYFKPENVQEVVLKRKGQSILLRKENGQWRIKKPLEADGDNKKIYDLLSVFDYGIVRVMETVSTDLSQYGLDRPTIEFRIKVKGQNAYQSLMIGGNNPDNSCVYARVKEQSGIFVLGIRYRIELSRDFSYFMPEAG